MKGCTDFSFLSSFFAIVDTTVFNAKREVLMYFPSADRSLSDVAFSDPAKSIKLCKGQARTSQLQSREDRQ